MSQFRASLERGDFTVTAEIGPPRGEPSPAASTRLRPVRLAR